jgi:hypothetical protein
MSLWLAELRFAPNKKTSVMIVYSNDEGDALTTGSGQKRSLFLNSPLQVP